MLRRFAFLLVLAVQVGACVAEGCPEGYVKRGELCLSRGDAGADDAGDDDAGHVSVIDRDAEARYCGTCPPGMPYCQTAIGVCFECLVDRDCKQTHRCEESDHTCVPR